MYAYVAERRETGTGMVRFCASSCGRLFRTVVKSKKRSISIADFVLAKEDT